MEKNNKNSQGYNNYTILKALEEVDESLAVKAISDPLLDGKELTSLLDYSIRGRVVNKHTNQPLKLSNKVLIAGMLNKLNQIHDRANNETI